MTKRSFDELEREYDREDPWGYKKNPADLHRKEVILGLLKDLGPFNRVLDLCCGEGWITQDLPAKTIYATEASVQARCRWNHKLTFWNPNALVDKHHKNRVRTFDLVMITGALYENYEWEHFIEIINQVAVKYILTCNIADRELPEAIAGIKAKEVFSTIFPYHRSPQEMFNQKLRIFKVQ